MKNIKPVQTQFTNAIATGATTAQFDYTNKEGNKSRQIIAFPIEGGIIDLKGLFSLTVKHLTGGSKAEFKTYYLERISNPVFA
tara:strand:- start:24 stop:272 length:249 start_codon:yes stop_codon:yes gene_type:complete